MDEASARPMTRIRPRTIPRRARSGFTLVELAVVVTIVGVLSVIGVVAYRRYMLTSKVSEATAMIGAIRIAQEDHRAERGTYANLGATYCPTGGGAGNLKAAWTPACTGGTADWTTLPVHADGPVMFQYATVAGTTPLSAPPSDAAWVNFGSPTASMWYIIMAKADLDGDPSNVTQLVGSSFQNTIFTRNEGL
jgi:type IV pilus assembly protein PilA